MRLIEITALGFRVLGILMFLNGLGGVASWLNANNVDFMVGSHIEMKVLAIILYGASLLISLILIAFPVSVAKLVVPISSTKSPELEADGRSIQYAGLTIIGVYVLSQAIPDLIYNVTTLYFVSASMHSDFETNQYLIDLITTAVEFCIGIYLTIGTHGIVNIISRLRG